MKVLLVIATIIVPVLMLYLTIKFAKLKLLFNLLAILSMLIFGSITATTIYQVIIDDAVFMTTIHGLFLNVLFLITGAYLGVFFFYRMIRLTMDEK